MAKKEVITRVFKSVDGATSTWQYENGRLVKVSIVYPEGYTSLEEDLKNKNKKVAKTKRQFINPKNGKKVGYSRAKALGLVK